jgi:hypothetical protein
MLDIRGRSDLDEQGSAPLGERADARLVGQERGGVNGDARSLEREPEFEEAIVDRPEQPHRIGVPAVHRRARRRPPRKPTS